MFKLVVLTCLLAAANAQWLGGWASPLAYGAAPLAYGAAPWVGAGNYRGPVSLAPGQPANILAADGRPLDTLDVNLDRSAHYTAKALEGSGVHLLKKRSIIAAAPVVASPLVARSPLAYSAGWASPYSGAWATPYASAWATPYASTWGAPYARAYGSPYGYTGLVRSW